MLEFERRRFFLVHLCNAGDRKGLEWDTVGPTRTIEAIPEKLTSCGSTAANRGYVLFKRRWVKEMANTKNPAKRRTPPAPVAPRKESDSRSGLEGTCEEAEPFPPT
ncbi:hypothetical protein QCE49_32985 [Caballeronia sp. LZ008]|uniref:hypothetical protein n=1 Tax=unclassified Caballeronia TaxID=2646786 RepID=UPI0020279F14|nr:MULTISPECIES: hypothetical protein [unclassified Caballeronia]MDR5798217.1 hypothetical protein [Caballeronia sp. LZ008]